MTPNPTQSSSEETTRKGISDDLRLFLFREQVIDRLPDWALRRLEEWLDEYIALRIEEANSTKQGAE